MSKCPTRELFETVKFFVGNEIANRERASALIGESW